MHDESIGRRLSAALRQEAEVLPFTITAAELERRLALRRRSFAGRRLTLLLAAAVGISLFGIGGALSGLFDQSKPEPTRPIATNPSEAPVAAKLATLNELVAVDPGSVLIAQGHGPADGPSTELDRYELPHASVVLGTFPPGIEYRVAVSCLGTGALVLDIRFPGSRGPRNGTSIACDGSTHEETFDSAQPQSVGFALSGPASWRVVARGTLPPVTLPLVPHIFPTPAGNEDLVRVDDLTIEDAGQPWGVSNLDFQEIGAIPPRETYDASTRCVGTSPVRFILGDTIDGAIVADTETQVACQTSGLWDVGLGIAEPNGSRVYLAADPGARVSFLLTSATPPVTLTRSMPGWQISGGIGPDLAFEAHTMSYSGAGVGEDHVLIVLACTGSKPIEAIVEDGKQIGSHTQKFEATCSPDGATTSQTFKVTEGGVGVRYVAPKGTWTALSILVPSN
jgi:hypothetical protein